MSDVGDVPTPKIVLITGCSSGLGEALATVLHAQTDPAGQPRYRVYASARRLGALQALSEAGIQTLELDVGSEASTRAAVSALLDKEGRVDVLVNNAGITRFGPLAEQPLDEVSAILDTNVLGALRAVVPSMVKRGEGLIVNIGSVSAWLATPYAGAYCASKAALHAISDSLRLELRPFGVRVTVVCAGAILSKFSDNAESAADGERYAAPTSMYSALVSHIRARTRMSQTAPEAQPAAKVGQRIADIINASTAPGGAAPSAWFFAGGAAFKTWGLGLVHKVFGWPLDSVIAGKFGLA